VRDRGTISSDGIMFVVATVSEQDGASLAPAEVVLRGVPIAGDEKAFVKRARKVIESSLDRAADEDLHEVDLLQKVLHDDLARFVHEDMRRRPMILPIVVEV
jgi:ribonuclease J